MPDVERIYKMIAEVTDKPPGYGVPEKGQWLLVPADLYRRVIRAADGERWRAKELALILLEMGVRYAEGRDNEVNIEMLEAYRRDAHSVFHREWARLGTPPKPRLVDRLVPAGELAAAE